MSLKSRLQADAEAISRQKEIEEEKEDQELKEQEKRKDVNLRKAERYYQKLVLPVLLEVNEAMGGEGPNPDGSLVWRGGKSWTWDPTYCDDEDGVTITAMVIWDKRPRGSRSGGYIVDGGLRIDVDSNGNANCSNYLKTNPTYPIDLSKSGAKEKLGEACFEVIRNINLNRRHPYIPGELKPKLPPEIIQERTNDIRERIVMPLFYDLARKYGVSMSQNPYIGYKLFTGEYHSEVPVRPGFSDHTLIIKILSQIGSNPTDAFAIYMYPSDHSVSIGEKVFDVTTKQGIKALREFTFEYAAREPRESFVIYARDEPRGEGY